MKLFRVLKREVWVNHYLVEANNEQEAKDLVHKNKGEIDEDCFEYSHDLDKDNWTTEIEDDYSEEQ